jgi:hypothetical protein
MTAAAAFNADLVTITRKRFSVTQGEVLIAYDGVRIEQYGDDIRLVGKEYQGMSDAEWLAVAKREALARGLATEPTPPAPSAKNARADIHRPSVIVPADYHYVGMRTVKIECLGDAEFARVERERIVTHMARTGGELSTHAHGGSCHVCGAHAVYQAVFYHQPSNAYICTGTDCADRLEWDSGDGEAFRKKARAAIDRQKGKGKAQAVLEADGLASAWEIYSSAAGEHERREEPTIRDIVGKLVQYGSISEAQTAFLRKLVDAVARRVELDAKRAAESAAASPVPVSGERITVRGLVVAVRKPDDFMVEPWRILVQHESGWKVWGTRAAEIASAAVGDEVEFSARVEPSRKDPKFGYFTRPTKARRVA